MSKVIAKQACTVCSKKGWWNLERPAYQTKIKTCLIAAGQKKASEIVQTAVKKAEIKDKETHKAWYASVPCSQCNMNGSTPAPELWYYRLIWTDKTNTCYVSQTDEGNGRDLTMEEFDALNEWANEEEDEEEDEEEEVLTAKQKKVKAANAKNAKAAPAWVANLFNGKSKAQTKQTKAVKANSLDLVIEGAPDEINALFQY